MALGSTQARSVNAGGPPILVGGVGPRRTLPLVARYADIWGAQLLTPEGVRERSARLDALLAEVGRPPDAVKRTMSSFVACGRDAAEFEARLAASRALVPSWAALPLDALLDVFRTNLHAVVGTPEEVAERIRAYGAAGIEEFMVQWTDPDDLEGLQVLAEQVAPLVQ